MDEQAERNDICGYRIEYSDEGIKCPLCGSIIKNKEKKCENCQYDMGIFDKLNTRKMFDWDDGNSRAETGNTDEEAEIARLKKFANSAMVAMDLAQAYICGSRFVSKELALIGLNDALKMNPTKLERM